MISPWVGIAAILATLGAMIGSLKLIELRLQPPPELLRKLMHVGMGLVVLTFPWLFDRQWPVVLLSGLALTVLIAVRTVPVLRDGVGTVLNGVRRKSLGEFYFPIAVGTLFYLSDRDPILFCVPMLIMTLADTLAALIGIAYGRVRYVTSDGLKSAEGSIAFFTVAFLSVHVPLLLATSTGRSEALLIAVIIGVLSTLIEAISWRGLDNLLIPLGAFAFLKLYLPKSEHELIVRLVATLVLLVFALSWRRRSSLDDSALMAGALFGYAAWMLGGPIWMIGPVLLFLAHVFAWPRAGERREHTVFAVLAVTGPALFWLAMYVRDSRAIDFVAYATSFGVQLAVVGISRISLREGRGKQGRRLVVWIAAGCVLALVQIAMARLHFEPRSTRWLLANSATSFFAIATAAGAFFAARPILYAATMPEGAIHTTGLVAGLGGSLVVVGINVMINI